MLQKVVSDRQFYMYMQKLIKKQVWNIWSSFESSIFTASFTNLWLVESSIIANQTSGRDKEQSH